MSEEDIELALAPRSLTLTDFLLARIAEDEAFWPLLPDEVEIIGGRFVRARERMKAECARDRRIVEHCEPDPLTLSPGDPYVLQLLALPYADHPDFREEWRV